MGANFINTNTGAIGSSPVPFSYEVRLATSVTHSVVSNVAGEIRLGFDANITEVSIYVETAGVTGVGTFDVHKNGTTILSTKLTLDSAEKTTSTAATPAVISVPSYTKDDILTLDIDGIHTTPAVGGVLRIQGTRT